MKNYLILFSLLLIRENACMPSEYSINNSFGAKSTLKPKIYSQQKLEGICGKFMQELFSENQNQWSCSFLNNNRTSKIKRNVMCLCSIEYRCNDNEEFHLDSELVSNMNFENPEEKEFYAKQCQNSLAHLTAESNWQCDLKLDRIQNNEFYCECKREKTCKIEKLLKFKNHILSNSS